MKAVPVFKPQTGWQKPSPKPLKRSPATTGKYFISTSYGGDFFSQSPLKQNSLLGESAAFTSLTRERYYDVHSSKKVVPPGGTYHPRFDLMEK